MTLAIPVSSSRLRNTTPRAVPGCCRCVTSPPTATAAPPAAAAIADVVSTPRADSRSLMCATGSVPYVPVAHRSANVSSAAVIGGSAGASRPGVVPGS